MKLFLAIFTLFFSLNVFAAADNKGITYKNQRGSTLTLILQEEKPNSGKVTGTFITNVSRCKDVIGKPTPVVGYYTGNAVAITASFSECDGVVVMTGVMNKDKTEVNMQWLVNRHVDDPVNENWDSFVIGTDQFKKIS
jgi:hypothetical protein